MKRQSLVEVIGGFKPKIVEVEKKRYQFYKDDNDEDAVEIAVDDEKEAQKKIRDITRRDPKRVNYWRVTKKGEKVEEADDDEYSDKWSEEDGIDMRYDSDEDEFQADNVDEYDAFIADNTRGGYDVSVNRKFLGNVTEYEEAVDMLVKWMNKNKYSPTVWMVSDHGNYSIDTDFPWEKVQMKEGNATDAYAGGEGPQRTPFAFQRKKPSGSDKRKEYKNATSSTGWTPGKKTNNYFKKLESMRSRVNTIVESTVVGLELVGDLKELKAKTTPDKHRERIALDTLKMPPAMAAVMGGGSVEDAIAFLKRIGYSDAEIQRLSENRVSEAKYSEWANDTSATPTQKINRSIQEVNRKLYEIETIVNRAMKLKTESGLEQDVFWKQTMGRFSKISERMLRVGNKLREFNK